MNAPKRKIFLIIIAAISILSTYQFIDVFVRFNFLLKNIENNIVEGVVIFMIITLFLSITSYLALVFNWKLLRISDFIAEKETHKQNQLGWLYFGYLAFCGLIEGLGVFLILETRKIHYSLGYLPDGFLPYVVGIIIVGIGIVFIYDGIKIRRAIIPN